MEKAEKGISHLVDNVDTLITIPNENLLNYVQKNTSLLDAFRIADDVLRQAVQGISDIITIPGLINVDFADVKAIMRDAGNAIMGMGIGAGENKAIEAATEAISNPLLDVSSMEGSTGVLVNVTGGADLTLQDYNEIVSLVTSQCDSEANIIAGTVNEPAMADEIRVTVIATGFKQRASIKNHLKEKKTFNQPLMKSELETKENVRKFKITSSNTNNFATSNRKPGVISDIEFNSTGIKKIVNSNNNHQDLNDSELPILNQNDKGYDQNNLEIPTFLRNRKD
jgi:cell division protein FtsZ